MLATNDNVETATTPKNIHTTVNYIKDPAKHGPPPYYFHARTAGFYRRKYDQMPVEISDLRGMTEKFNLDTQGFQVVNYESQEKDFQDEGIIKGPVYDEIRDLLKKSTGATRVLPFMHSRRLGSLKSSRMVDALEGLDDQDRVPGPPPAAHFAHIDQSYTGAIQVLEDHLDQDDVAKMTKSRWGIMNVWHPIHNPATRDPLAVCDARSADDTDLRPVRPVMPKHYTDKTKFAATNRVRQDEMWELVPNPSHKWYYVSEQRPDEALVFKMYDSKLDGRARRCPHSAFTSQEDHGPERESIEVRSLVFWEDQSPD